MKKIVRNIIRVTAGWPVIGRIVRIAAAIYRLPELRSTHNHQMPYVFNAVIELSQGQQELSQRQLTFEAEQLPTLLQTLSDVNSRLVECDKSINHLMASVPVALRKITREQISFAGQLNSTVEHLGQLNITVEHLDNAVKVTNKHLENLSASTEYLLGRVEFVRRELLFEQRYGASDPSDSQVKLTVEAQVVFPEKLVEARGNLLRLNLGCGHKSLEGYLNVDRRALPGVDIIAEVNELPLEPGEVDEFFSAHLLEHFPQEQLRRELLPYYFSLLKPGGKFLAIVPDGEAMIREYSEGVYPYDDMREVLYGAQDYNGDFHFNLFTPASMTKLLEEAGFVDIKIVEAARKNGKCFEFEIVAVKPGAENG